MTSQLAHFTKDPNANLDYKIAWSRWLPEGDSLASSTWLVPSGITSTDESSDETSATVWLSGGEVGKTYEVTNRVTTAAGRSDDRTIYITVLNR